MADEYGEDEVHVSLDLETMGLIPGRAVLSIGAVRFDPEGFRGTIGALKSDVFHVGIDLTTSLLAGLTVDPETVAWWRSDKVSDEAREAMTDLDKIPLYMALEAFDEWWAAVGATHVWANGPAADVVWLEACYTACEMRPPWSHRGVRCYRTIVDLAKLDCRATPRVAHDALGDAIAQADDIQRAHRTLKGWREAHEQTLRDISNETLTTESNTIPASRIAAELVDGAVTARRIEEGAVRAVPRYPGREFYGSGWPAQDAPPHGSEPGILRELEQDENEERHGN